MADGGHPEPVQIRSRFCRVSLEVPVERLLLLRPRELIAGERKVIHADVVVSAAGKDFDRHLEDCELLLRRRKVLGMNQLLVRFHPGDMGVVEDRDPVGPKRNDLAYRRLKRGKRLEREAVDQVAVDAGEPGLPCPVIHLSRHRLRLHPVHRLLHPFVEVLHSHAHPVEAGVAEGNEVIAGQLARIDFHAHLRRRVDPERRTDRLSHPADFVRRQVGRRPASPVHLDHAPSRRDHRRHELDLPGQMRGCTPRSGSCPG